MKPFHLFMRIPTESEFQCRPIHKHIYFHCNWTVFFGVRRWSVLTPFFSRQVFSLLFIICNIFGFCLILVEDELYWSLTLELNQMFRCKTSPQAGGTQRTRLSFHLFLTPLLLLYPPLPPLPLLLILLFPGWLKNGIIPEMRLPDQSPGPLSEHLSSSSSSSSFSSSMFIYDYFLGKLNLMGAWENLRDELSGRSIDSQKPVSIILKD